MRLIQFAHAAALAGFAVLAGPMALQAKTVPLPPPSCVFGTSSTTGVDVWNSTACVNSIGGNDSDKTVGNGVTNVNTAVAGGGLFGINAWTLNSRYSITAGGSISGLLSGAGTGQTGTWSVSSWSGIGAAMLVVKAGNNFVSYLLDISAGLGGGWSTQALRNGGGQIPGISHVSLYTIPGTTPPPAPVPVPAAGLLLIGALGGLAALRGKKRQA